MVRDLAGADDHAASPVILELMCNNGADDDSRQGGRVKYQGPRKARAKANPLRIWPGTLEVILSAPDIGRYGRSTTTPSPELGGRRSPGVKLERKKSVPLSEF